MKKLIFILLLIIVSGCSNKVFHYQDKVKIIGGFYQGSHGIIENEAFLNRYLVRICDGITCVHLDWISKSNLEEEK